MEINMDIKLIAIDIDGTLVNSKKELTEGVKLAIEKAKKQGIKVVICTGRPLPGALKLLAELGLDNDDNQYVVSFGGAVVQSTSGKVIYHYQM